MTAPDIVYFVKNAPHNEELRYSLRSIEKNFQPHGLVWIYGFCPYELNTDRIINIEQMEPTKWQNVRKMLKAACENDDITPDFWLFNDDFFIMKPIDPRTRAQQYDGTLQKHIDDIERRHSGQQTEYTKRLRHLMRTLKSANITEPLNYAVHAPLLVNRKKMLKTLEAYPDEPMSRALYGNIWSIGGEDIPDCKIAMRLCPNHKDRAIISTEDMAFANLEAGQYIRDQFPDRSKYEVD